MTADYNASRFRVERFSMLIQRLEISNFRSLRSIDLGCDELIALLGRNGGGKSSILFALAAFYDVAAPFTIEDFYGRDPTKPIMVRVAYGHLRTSERRIFASFIHDDQLIVTKQIEHVDGRFIQRYFAAARQIAEFAELRKLGKRERVTKYKELAASGKFPGLDASVRSADQADVFMAKYESDHAELLQTVEREEQFFGPKEVGGGKLDHFTKFVLVPAVRNAAGEAQKKGVIYDLIDMIVLRRVNARKDVRDLRAEMKDKISKVFSPENLTELSHLGESISTLLEQYAPGASLDLSWGEPVPPEIQLPPARADLVEDDYACPISHSGHGLQRALVLTLLQHLAMTERPIDDDEVLEAPVGAIEELPPPVAAEGAPAAKAPPAAQVVTDILSPDLILAIEEPELYLHPSRCRYLSDLLLRLSRAPKGEDQPRNQIIYATHSPYFVDLHRFDQVRLVRKPKVDGLPAPCCVVRQYSLDQAAKALAAITGRDPKDFTRDSFRARALPVMTIAVNEGFFASTVVVVEGLSDVGVLWKLQEVMKQNWHARGIAVVPAIGKENLDRPVVVFRGLAIPTYFIFDGDSKHKGGKKDKEEQAKSRNVRYQRMAGVEPVEFPVTQSHQEWAVYSNDLETEMKDAVGSSVFEELAQQAADDLHYDGTSQLLKNIEGAARVIELIYSVGKRVPVLETIVEQITALRLSERGQAVTKPGTNSPATSPRAKREAASSHG